MNQGEVCLVEFPSTNGHEQAGTRPVIILAETEANVVMVIPLTTNTQALRFPHTVEVRPSGRNGLTTISIGLVFQLRAIDKKRMKKKIGVIEESILRTSHKIIKNMLNLP